MSQNTYGPCGAGRTKQAPTIPDGQPCEPPPIIPPDQVSMSPKFENNQNHSTSAKNNQQFMSYSSNNPVSM
ncbi:hypothetical protein SUGI_1104020 [Cryptomeria japonica]|nr:hypothetical protein SUGI_1103810 [Cryptomeria japonica]GLJ51951.1 hypothetical protein SUGI_1104020 [Cryptomeria japonica]